MNHGNPNVGVVCVHLYAYMRHEKAIEWDKKEGKFVAFSIDAINSLLSLNVVVKFD